MWPVSQRFRDTVPASHLLATTVTVIPPGGGATGLQVVSSGSNTVTVDRSQRIRRTANLTVRGGTAVYDLLSTPGLRVAVDHGFAWSGLERELVPMIRGEITSGSLRLGSGVIGCTVADLWQRLAASDYVDPFAPDVATTRVQAIIAAVTGAMPGLPTSVTATDTGTVGAAQAWTSRADMVNAFATDGGMEAFFGPDGVFMLRDIPQITDPVAWTIRTGDSGTLKDLTRSRPLDRVINTVIVTPATADPAQDWASVVAQVTDPSDPRHPDRIGVRPYRYQAPTLLTEDDAIRVAGELLAKLRGTTETLAIEMKPNAALEPGDIIRAQTPLDGGADIVNHFLENVTTDLIAGSQSGSTRSSTEVGS